MQALDGADALAIMTEWGEFRTPDFDEMQRLHEGARRSSTAATSTTPPDAGRRLHLPLHRQGPRPLSVVISLREMTHRSCSVP